MKRCTRWTTRISEAVLLHHFEQRCSYAEIGFPFWPESEDAAPHGKVNRALEKLHDTLRQKRGVTSTALALAGLLAGNAVEARLQHIWRRRRPMWR